MKIKEIEKQYGVDFGLRKDKNLSEYLKEQGYPYLSKALTSIKKINEKLHKKT